jgi:hypothetical protein
LAQMATRLAGASAPMPAGASGFNLIIFIQKKPAFYSAGFFV